MRGSCIVCILLIDHVLCAGLCACARVLRAMARGRPQVFNAIRDKPQRLLRARLDDRGRLFTVAFTGEGGNDHGGLYRDVMQVRVSLPMVCSDLI